jgi:argininosuccinate synthase
MEQRMPTIVLAYAGGPAARAAVPWLRTMCGASVVTVTLDVGQDRDLHAVRDQALASGAVRAHVLDRRDAYTRDFLLPALKADAHIPSSSLTCLLWPLLAQTLVDVAAMELASSVAHACADSRMPWSPAAQVEAAVRALGPDLDVIAAAGVVANDRHDGSAAAPTPPPSPDEPALVEVTLARGVPTALNGIDMPLAELVATLNTIAGAYDATRAELTADDMVPAGAAPGALSLAVLQSAHRGLRLLVNDDRLNEFCEIVGREYGAMLMQGAWFSPMRRALDGFAGEVQEVQARVNGTVRLRLSAGGCEQVSISSPFTRASSSRRVSEAQASEGQSIAL